MRKSVAVLVLVVVTMLIVGRSRFDLMAEVNDASPAKAADAEEASFLPVAYSNGVGQGAPEDPKPATDFTKAVNAKYNAELPWSDNQGYADAAKNLIAPLPGAPIVNPEGGTIWDPAAYSFIPFATPAAGTSNPSGAPDTVNPSLWRQGQLVNHAGLFKVTDHIYQVRNYDLSNLTIIEGRTGLIVADPLVSTETARAALKLYRDSVVRDATDNAADARLKQVAAVIFSHSHVDHFGGALGVATTGTTIVAPSSFLAAASAENLYAGDAMGRRATYMYGSLIPNNAEQGVGSGLGMTISTGETTLLAPTVTISTSGTTTIDGLTFDFLLVPNTEAPSEMMWYLPEFKALNGAEDATQTMHNIYSLRGAKVRDPLAWSKDLNQALVQWGGDVEVLYNMHHWPTWGNAAVVKHLQLQRDLYRFINDQALNLANQGYTPVEIAEMIQLPKVQEQTWTSRGYYGSLSHNVKSVYNLYLGWFDGNPANLNPLPPVEASQKYVELIGGSAKVLAAGQAAFDKGEYRWAAELLNHLVFADPTNEAARFLQADTLEQLGYQAESGPWRNFYLSGAQELRHGVAPDDSTGTAGELEVLTQVEATELFDFMGIHLDAAKAEGKSITLNWVLTDKPQPYFTELVHSVINNTPGTSSAAEATVTVSSKTLLEILVGTTTLDAAIGDGRVQITGSKAAVIQYFSYMETFNADGPFNIVTP